MTSSCTLPELYATSFHYGLKGINWQFPRMLGDIYIHPETWGGQKHTFWVSAVSLEDAHPLQDKGPALLPIAEPQH